MPPLVCQALTSFLLRYDMSPEFPRSHLDLYPSHGDLSFSNVVISRINQHPYIIDIDGINYGLKPLWFDTFYFILTLQSAEFKYFLPQFTLSL